jgi:hypothetical protein
MSSCSVRDVESKRPPMHSGSPTSKCAGGFQLDNQRDRSVCAWRRFGFRRPSDPPLSPQLPVRSGRDPRPYEEFLIRSRCQQSGYCHHGLRQASSCNHRGHSCVRFFGPTVCPFAVTEVNVRTTKAYYMAYLPCAVMDFILGEDATAYQAYEIIIPMLVDVGLVDICDPLVEFLTLALVKSSARRSTPLAVQTQVGVSVYLPSPAAISY